MTTHDLAKDLRNLADKLEAADSALAGNEFLMLHLWFQDKAAFVSVAKAIGGIKKLTDWDYELNSECGLLRICLKIPRNAVCRLVEPAKPAVYECEPLLSEAELSEVSDAQ
jgi:hypothetical protein